MHPVSTPLMLGRHGGPRTDQPVGLMGGSRGGGGGGRRQREGLTFRFRFLIMHCWLLKAQ